MVPGADISFRQKQRKSGARGQEMGVMKLSWSSCLVVLVFVWLIIVSLLVLYGGPQTELIWLLSLGQIIWFITDLMSAPVSRFILIRE